MSEVLSVRETPPVAPGANDAYRTAREELRRAEVALRDQVEAVAAKRRALPPGPQVRDYAFREGDKRVLLSELFAGERPQLIVYHVMYWADDDEFCPMCSMWVDGLNAVAKHVERTANIAVASRAPQEKLQAWVKRRGWDNIRVLSDEGPDFAHDIGAEDTNGDPVETVAVFTKDGAAIRNTYIAHAFNMGEVRGIDLLTPVWSLLDLLPSGRGDWNPSNEYPTRA